ncbi:6-phospho-3-hexuloisomerase [Lactonifactor longoviformis]|uniref:6-phospho-3-hexuloisomerase n=1 Tax=Lactonifactor longoviformis TaxID=341220 RepID=UPI00210C2190|nr:6-phospho-3-hexuloisomerase [Lactonifactor longoviformis]MCQ4670104.1 6-phospho-3-hexuloisomerase [Lactonifactor longoviformis]
MSYIDTYKKYYQAIIQEHEAVFEKLDMEQLKGFVDLIVKSNKIFVHGAGREGISLRAFAMRLAHLGKPTYWLMDDTTIGMHEGDLLIISDGFGDVGIHRRIEERASKTGAKVAIITGLPEGGNVKNFADFVLFIPAAVYMGKDREDPDAPRQHDVVPTIQPMGNLYEQHLYLLMDIAAILIKDEMGLTYDDMEANHRNIE